MRSGSRCAGGTRYGIPAPAILSLARTSRLAIVGSDTRNARAISAVVRPASVRSVSATRPSSGSAGWQQVKISRSRSSSIPLSSSGSFIGVGSSSASAATSASSSALPSRSRRSRSIARLRATVVSHAPGRRGTPSRGQRRSASANASCAHSSARSQSPVRLIRVATIAAPLLAERRRRPRVVRPASLRPRTVAPRSIPYAGDRVLGGHLDRLVEVGALEDVVAGDVLLGLGERAVGEHDLAVADADGRRVGRSTATGCPAGARRVRPSRSPTRSCPAACP